MFFPLPDKEAFLCSHIPPPLSFVTQQLSHRILWSFSIEFGRAPILFPFPFTSSFLFPLPSLAHPCPVDTLQVQVREAGGEGANSLVNGSLVARSLSLFPLTPALEITVPIRHSQQLPGKVEFGVYESGPRKSVFPPRTELRRGDWKTDSTSSTASEQADPAGAFIAGL